MRNSSVAKAASFLAALAAFAGLCVFAFSKIGHTWDWRAVGEYRVLYWKGWWMTLRIAAIALPASAALGLALALARRSAFLPLRYAAQIWVEVMRGTPLLVQIFIYFYVFGTAMGVENRYILGPLILAAFTGAYMSEIIRGGIESVGASQWESARAIGLTTAQTYRHVVFPQAVRQLLPAFAGQFASLVKDSSLLSVIALNEFTQAAGEVASLTALPFEPYLPLAVGYLAITLPVSLWSQAMERRVKFET